MIVRPARLEDAKAIAEIYNHFVVKSTSTFETEPVDVHEMVRRVDEAIGDGYPFLTAVDEGDLIGYAYGHRYRDRFAYAKTVEISVYVHPEWFRKGVAVELYTSLFKALQAAHFHAVIAGIALPNDASVALHQKFGMQKIAHFTEVGRKFGSWIDVGYWVPPPRRCRSI
jgi:L-amino acid N-acyltransferase YncA